MGFMSIRVLGLSVQSDQVQSYLNVKFQRIELDFKFILFKIRFDFGDQDGDGYIINIIIF